MRHFICRPIHRNAMKKLVPFIAVSALSACGFHLKGTYAYDHLPEQKWYISGGQLQKPLENAIRHASGTPVAQAAAQAEFVAATKVMDRIADKGVFHKNKAARHKSRLAAKIKAMA